MRAVGELSVHLLLVEAQDSGHDRRDLRRIDDLQRVRIDGRRLLAESELDARAVVDRPPGRRDRHRLTVLLGRHRAERLRADALEPRGAQERQREENGEDGEEEADPAVREPTAQRARGVTSR